MENSDKPVQERKIVNVDSLKDIAVYLSGVKDGKGGNLYPLGTVVLDDLWDAIAYLQGDVRFKLLKD